jgi:hypothetical protein
MQVERGKKRDSINQDDYEKIIDLRSQKIELSEYVQKDQVRKEVTDIVNHQKYLKLAQNQPLNKSVSAVQQPVGKRSNNSSVFSQY